GRSRKSKSKRNSFPNSTFATTCRAVFQLAEQFPRSFAPHSKAPRPFSLRRRGMLAKAFAWLADKKAGQVCGTAPTGATRTAAFTTSFPSGRVTERQGWATVISIKKYLDLDPSELNKY